MARTPEQLVEREVYYCVSFLISTLAGSYGSIENSERLHSRGREAQAALSELTEQAMDLCSPIDDWEEAASQEGWTMDYAKAETIAQDHGYTTQGLGPDLKINPAYGNDDNGMSEAFDGTWQELCEWAGIEPYQREVFEHWIVSDWLADKLEAKGEKVAKDIGGMTIWARTTTGQGIASDYVIERIAADLSKEG